MGNAPPKLLVLYHFFHPDQVVSARIFTDFAVEQARRGWNVTALTTVRAHGDLAARFPADEVWNGVRIHRVFRLRPGRRRSRCRAWATAPGRSRPGS